MTATTKPITIEQGATFTLPFTWHLALVDADGNLVLDANGNAQPGEPKDLTGWTARMQVRKKVGSEVLLEATSEAGITLGGTAGTVRVKFTDEQTDTLMLKAAVYDLELEDEAGDVYRLLEGTVTIKPNVTRTEATP